MLINGTQLFTFLIVNIKPNINYFYAYDLVIFTFLIVNIKPVEGGNFTGNSSGFTFLIVNIKQWEILLLVLQFLHLHSS